MCAALCLTCVSSPPLVQVFVGGVGIDDATLVAVQIAGPPPAHNASCGLTLGQPTAYALVCAQALTAAACQQFDSTCDWVLPPAPPEGPHLLCFSVACHAPSIQTKGVVVQEGCAAGGTIGDTCRLGCSAGYDETEAVEGTCVVQWLELEEVAMAEYANQAVTCSPARNADGSMVRARFLLNAAALAECLSI